MSVDYLPPPPERHRWTLHEMQVGEMRFYPDAQVKGENLRSAAQTAKKKHGMRFRIRKAMRANGVDQPVTGFNIWRLE
ncbi:MAG: hypothetical protein ING29_13155 [Azospirillum sp.]|nr:hypothetical protein [Azospirillum sp.]